MNFNYNEIFEAKVNIKLKEPLKMSSPSSFNSVFFTNGESGAKIDLLKLLVVSPLLQDIVLSLGVPISWLEDLNVIVPEISWNSLALFKSFVEEASIAKIPIEDCHELLSTLAIFGNSTFAEPSSESEDIDDETNFVNECDRIPELSEVDSINDDSNSSARNSNDNATGDHNYSKPIDFMEDFLQEVNRELKNDEIESEEDKDDVLWTPTHRRIVLKKKKGFGKGKSSKRFKSCGKCFNCHNNHSLKVVKDFLNLTNIHLLI